MAFDWLFQGSPTPAVTTASTSETGLPAWYQDYVKNLVMRSSELAGQPYQPYTGPRIEGFAPMQEQAQAAAQGVNQNFRPMVGQAQGMLQGAAGPASAGIAGYMNPYQTDYLSQIGRLASRNLTENILPGVNATFTGGGSFGGTRHADFTNRAIRDTQEAVSNAMQQGLHQGWTQAGQFAGADLQRMGQAGQGMGALSKIQQAGDIAGMGALGAAGAEQQGMGQRNLDLAYQDFLRQQAHPYEQAGFMQGIIKGAQPSLPTFQTQTSTTPTGYNPSPLSQFAQFSGLLGGFGELLGGLR